MKRAKRHPPPLTKPRNPVARSPLMAKGGPHQKSVSTRRQHAKRDLERVLREVERDE